MKTTEFPWFRWHKDTPHYTVLIQTEDGTFANSALYFETEFLAYRYARKNLYSLGIPPYVLWILGRIDEKAKLPIWSFEIFEDGVIRNNYKKGEKVQSDKISNPKRLPASSTRLQNRKNKR